jgi:hypothetical protein
MNKLTSSTAFAAIAKAKGKAYQKAATRCSRRGQHPAAMQFQVNATPANPGMSAVNDVLTYRCQ